GWRRAGLISTLRAHPPDRVALVAGESQEPIPYGTLADEVTAIAEHLHRSIAGRALVFLAMGPDADAVRLYLACLEAALPVCLCEPQAIPMAKLADVYRPVLALLPGGLEPAGVWRGDGKATAR